MSVSSIQSYAPPPTTSCLLPSSPTPPLPFQSPGNLSLLPPSVASDSSTPGPSHPLTPHATDSTQTSTIAAAPPTSSATATTTTATTTNAGSTAGVAPMQRVCGIVKSEVPASNDTLPHGTSTYTDTPNNKQSSSFPQTSPTLSCSSSSSSSLTNPTSSHSPVSSPNTTATASGGDTSTKSSPQHTHSTPPPPPRPLNRLLLFIEPPPPSSATPSHVIPSITTTIAPLPSQYPATIGPPSSSTTSLPPSPLLLFLDLPAGYTIHHCIPPPSVLSNSTVPPSLLHHHSSLSHTPAHSPFAPSPTLPQLFRLPSPTLIPPPWPSTPLASPPPSSAHPSGLSPLSHALRLEQRADEAAQLLEVSRGDTMGGGGVNESTYSLSSYNHRVTPPQHTTAASVFRQPTPISLPPFTASSRRGGGRGRGGSRRGGAKRKVEEGTQVERKRLQLEPVGVEDGVEGMCNTKGGDDVCRRNRDEAWEDAMIAEALKRDEEEEEVSEWGDVTGFSKGMGGKTDETDEGGAKKRCGGRRGGSGICSMCQTVKTPQWRYLEDIESGRKYLVCNSCYMRIRKAFDKSQWTEKNILTYFHSLPRNSPGSGNTPSYARSTAASKKVASANRTAPHSLPYANAATPNGPPAAPGPLSHSSSFSPSGASPVSLTNLLNQSATSLLHSPTAVRPALDVSACTQETVTNRASLAAHLLASQTAGGSYLFHLSSSSPHVTELPLPPIPSTAEHLANSSAILL
eukprot:GHVS01003210.1.p1 GENE.GHVS01003210.1~~GHVS01003210.1.p1  ORF type:complete len:740 (-),score=163.40 GHVS01003210.1:358-2577(-)